MAKVGVTHSTEGNKVENQTRSKGLDRCVYIFLNVPFWDFKSLI